MSQVAQVRFTAYESSIPRALDLIGAGDKLPPDGLIILKPKLHQPSTDDSVVDVCLYKKPDLSVVDASVALTGGHLAGKKKNVGLILAGFDPVAVDAVGSRLLGHEPEWVHYLTLAEGRLGSMHNIEILTA